MWSPPRWPLTFWKKTLNVDSNPDHYIICIWLLDLSASIQSPKRNRMLFLLLPLLFFTWLPSERRLMWLYHLSIFPQWCSTANKFEGRIKISKRFKLLKYLMRINSNMQFVDLLGKALYLLVPLLCSSKQNTAWLICHLQICHIPDPQLTREGSDSGEVMEVGRLEEVRNGSWSYWGRGAGNRS